MKNIVFLFLSLNICACASAPQKLLESDIPKFSEQIATDFIKELEPKTTPIKDLTLFSGYDLPNLKLGNSVKVDQEEYLNKELIIKDLQKVIINECFKEYSQKEYFDPEITTGVISFKQGELIEQVKQVHKLYIFCYGLEKSDFKDGIKISGDASWRNSLNKKLWIKEEFLFLKIPFQNNLKETKEFYRLSILGIFI